LLDNTKITPIIQEARVGDNVTFDCASLVPPKWYFNFTYLPLNAKIIGGNRVLINHFLPRNRGYFTCVGWGVDVNPYQFVARATLRAHCKSNVI